MKQVDLLNPLSSENSHGPVLLRLRRRWPYHPEEAYGDYGYEELHFFAFNWDGKGGALAVAHMEGEEPKVVGLDRSELGDILELNGETKMLSEFVLSSVAFKAMVKAYHAGELE